MMRTFNILIFGAMLLLASCRIDPELKESENKPVSPVGKATPYQLQVPKSLQGMPTYIPVDNPLTVEGISLGRKLFYDSILSKDNSISCGSCHGQNAAFSDAPNRFSKGVGGALGDVNSMALFNLAFQKGGLFWDGREPTLEKQILRPVENPVEMHLSWQEAVQRIKGRNDYAEMYERAFGTKEITKEGAAKSIAQFLRTIVSGNSPYDRSQLSAAANRGKILFLTAPTVDPRTGYRNPNTGLDCVHCHNPPLFQPEAKLDPFMNNGTDSTKKFRVPSLRNIALTHAYMHDGRFSTLADVVKHYNDVKKSPGIDPNMFVIKHAVTKPGGQSVDVKLNITTKEANDLIAFL